MYDFGRKRRASDYCDRKQYIGRENQPMDLTILFSPIDDSVFSDITSPTSFYKSIRVFSDKMPDYRDAQMAIIGVKEERGGLVEDICVMGCGKPRGRVAFYALDPGDGWKKTFQGSQRRNHLRSFCLSSGLPLFYFFCRLNTSATPSSGHCRFLFFLFFLWLAFRFPLVVAMAGICVASLLAIYFTVGNEGPFVLADAYSSVLLLQIFITVMSISTLVLSATVTERTVAQRTLVEFNENLEARIHERTHALHEEIVTRKEAEAELQKTNMELSKRNTELDNFVYSVSHDLRAPIASVLGLINLAKKDENRQYVALQ